MLAQYTQAFLDSTAFSALTISQAVMIVVSVVLLYLGIKKGYEPMLLIPIGFGMLWANLPLGGLTDEGGLLNLLYKGIPLYPSLIFVGVGALTDFGPLIASPRTLLLGAAAQLGVFGTLLGVLLLNSMGIEGLQFTMKEAASISIIGGADGPTAIFLTTRLAPHMLAAIAVAAYSYMALVPIIQPPIIKALTTPKERTIEMTQLRPVSKTERIIFPMAVVIVGSIVVPSAAPLLGSLMFGNLLRESGVVERLSKTAQNELINIVTIFLGLSVGATAKGETFLTVQTISIIIMGLLAFSFGTAGGVIFGKIMCFFSKGKLNPMIGAAGVSAVPMAARVVQKIGQEANPRNYLLMHAMGPNVAGVIGSAVAAGLLLSILG